MEKTGGLELERAADVDSNKKTGVPGNDEKSHNA